MTSCQRVVDIGIADIAREQRAAFERDLLRQLERAAVNRLQIFFAADHAQFFAMRVVRERFDDIGAGVPEVAMQLCHRFRMLEH